MDQSSPLFSPGNVPDGALLSSLNGGVTFNVVDPVAPSDLNNPLGVPTQFQVPTLDPSTATNISNYALINLGPDRKLGTSDDVDYSNYITGATYTDTTNRLLTNDWYTGQVHLSFATGLPAGYYMLAARTPQQGYQGITDAAGNGLDGDFNNPGLQNFAIKFDLQPVATYVTDVAAISPKGSGTVSSGPRSYFEVPVVGTMPRAEAPPNQFNIDFSETLAPGDYSDKIWLIRSADSPTSAPDGDFGVDPTFGTGVGFTRVTNVTVTLQNSQLIGGGDPSVPGYQNRLVVKLNPGTTLPPDHYRLYIPNQVMSDGRDLRIYDVYGNQIDGEFLGNPKPNGQGWETLLPTGQYRTGMSGDLVPGGSFETGYVVVPNGNVIFARPDYVDDPLLTTDDPDGSRSAPLRGARPGGPAQFPQRRQPQQRQQLRPGLQLQPRPQRQRPIRPLGLLCRLTARLQGPRRGCGSAAEPGRSAAPHVRPPAPQPESEPDDGSRRQRQRSPSIRCWSSSPDRS